MVILAVYIYIVYTLGIGFQQDSNFLKETQWLCGYNLSSLRLQQIPSFYKIFTVLTKLVSNCTYFYNVPIFLIYYSLRTSSSSWILLGHFTQVLKISGWFKAATISFTHLDTDDCDKFINRLLPTDVWYDPVAKKFKATKS